MSGLAAPGAAAMRRHRDRSPPRTNATNRLHATWLATVLALLLTGCGSLRGGPVAYRTDVGAAVPTDCSADSAAGNPACEHATPELSVRPRYTLHFAEFDDEGWLFPGSGDDGYRPEMGRAHAQIDHAIEDLQAKLAKGPVLLIVYVHGWKHSAWYQDSDVQRFREILADAANADRPSIRAEVSNRQVVGIYVGWRGNTFPTSEPWSNVTFWARKAAALRVAAGSVRELFARIRTLRNDWHPEKKGLDADNEPFLRSIVIGHSFGAQIAYASLEPSILMDLAAPTADAATWRSNRLKQTTDLTILLNPAFEASAYEPVDRLARAFRLPSAYEPPVLVTVTSTADRATGTFFPLGRFVSTLDERPFVSGQQSESVLRTPGFVDRYRTHRLRPDDGPVPPPCEGWRDKPNDETLDLRNARGYENVRSEIDAHADWAAEVASWHAMPPTWTWRLCGHATLEREQGEHPDIVWNVQTTEALVPGHNEIMGDPFVSFLRQLYLDVMYPPRTAGANPAR